MKITCLGATRTVTGSSFKIDVPQSGSLLLDCGLFQGGRQTEIRNFNNKPYDAENLRAIVLTHAHMDHSGLVPRLVKNGFNGPVYATNATCKLLEILWQDGAYIQQHEANWKSRSNRRRGQKDVEALYTDLDATNATNLLVPIPVNEPTELFPGVVVQTVKAGHILGATSVHFTLGQGDEQRRVVFSGDIGRTGQILMPDPEIPPQADLIFMETTYGNRLHKDIPSSKAELLEVIQTAYRENGSIIIPAFAVERTQELLYLLAQSWQEGEIPKDIPIILDSPLAIKATEIYAKFPEFYSAQTQIYAKEGLNLPTLKFTRETAESQKINELKTPAIIMAGSGMANAGRVLHHLKHHLWRKNSHIVFVGFQSQGTTGRRLVEGAEKIRIFRENINVEAKIHTIGGFSGHADQKELLNWLEPQIRNGINVNLIHGEETGTKAFYDLVSKKWPEANFNIPNWYDEMNLADKEVLSTKTWSAPLEAPKSTDWEKDSFKHRMARLNEAVINRSSALPPDKLAQLESLLLQAEDIALDSNSDSY